MSATTFNESWAWNSPSNGTDDNPRTWTASISRSAVSTVEGLGPSDKVDAVELNSLESLLRTVQQQQQLKRFHAETLKNSSFVAAGETFSVSQCQYEGQVVAIKHIRLHADQEYFQRRLHSVQREILIMCHPPLAVHPNVTSLLGYGWTIEEKLPSPFLVAEFASGGSLRAHLKERKRAIGDKMILIGEIAAGLTALHQCGIVHGDLKADNVVVFFSPQRPSLSMAKISDFGHSIIVAAAAEKRTKYLGTTIYNAPEVAEQRNRPIPADQLHKCDIWAFGLCVWEILADGRVYTHGNAHDNQQSPSRFDVSHLQSLAMVFLESMVIPGVGFERGFLRPLLHDTLQVDPNQRISDLSRLSIIRAWKKLPGGHVPRPKLATYALSGDIRYSIFAREGVPHILWEQQCQFLQYFEAEAQRVELSKKKGDTSAVFQAMLCYVNGFGTSRDLSKGAEFLRKSQEMGHFLAELLGPRMLSGFGHGTSEAQMEYSQCLAAGFRAIGEAEQSSRLVVHPDGVEEFPTSFESYTAFHDAFILEESGMSMAEDDLAKLFITRASSSARFSILEIAIEYGDLELVKILLSRFKKSWDALVSSPGSVVDDAARHGYGALAGGTSEEDLRVALSLPIHYNTILHTQWPFHIDSLPLHTAIASGCLDAIKTLLALGARPLESVNGLTAIHWAVRYHFPDALQTLWRAAFNQAELDPRKAYEYPALAEAPIACFLSLLTHAERFAMHGGNYKNNIQKIIELLPREILTQRSPEGKSALTQAIDLEDVDVLELILEKYPELAYEKLVQPGNEELFTYPLHFAVQVGSGRDTNESIQILEIILRLHSLAIDCPDSASSMPLHVAALGTSSRVTKWLLDLGASPNQINRRGQGPLHVCHSSDIANALLLKGADVNRKDELGFTPVIAATMTGAEDILQLLIDAGADLSFNDNGIGTPLHSAVHQRSLSMTKLLLKANVNVDAVDRYGRTSLFVAMGTNKFDLVSLLLEHGSDPVLEDEQGSSPFRLALAWESPEIFDTIRRSSKFDNLSWDSKIKTLHFAARQGQPAALKMYLDQLFGPSLDAVDCSSGQKYSIATSLNIAASACRVDLVEVLLSHGFSVDHPDSKGNTPLLLSCQAGQEIPGFNPYLRRDVCETLIKNGANIFAANDDGQTPFISATNLLDFPVMTLLLDRALELSGRDMSSRKDRLVSCFRDYALSMRGNDIDQEYCQEARGLIDVSIITPKILSQAVLQEEWDFVMTYVGGHFITHNDLCENKELTGPGEEEYAFKRPLVRGGSPRPGKFFHAPKTNSSSSSSSESDPTESAEKDDSSEEIDFFQLRINKYEDSIDALRFFCLTKNREMVRYEHMLLHGMSMLNRHSFSSRNHESESADTKEMLSNVRKGGADIERRRELEEKKRAKRGPMRNLTSWLTGFSYTSTSN
ncbi:hypothetical protein N7492_002084 [Penicillium capsulatum]|uniref:Protein kinase domain-containing protein n=1 Tax=Penicillium capsulatum TaxID=69766 RepID=A0A9W9IH65_9EURO|nr:hypothetical protein N7492_002084 [Penicillium capsulatum]KAJ6123302.1 hypothetical protein N7512_005767 [Penicillium capsulatum]